MKGAEASAAGEDVAHLVQAAVHRSQRTREQSRPGGAKPGHAGHKRALSPDPDTVVDHRSTRRPACGLALSADLPAEVVSVHEEIDIPPVKPRVE